MGTDVLSPACKLATIIPFQCESMIFCTGRSKSTRALENVICFSHAGHTSQEGSGITKFLLAPVHCSRSSNTPGRADRANLLMPEEPYEIGKRWRLRSTMHVAKCCAKHVQHPKLTLHVQPLLSTYFTPVAGRQRTRLNAARRSWDFAPLCCP